jgi:hypothetical protein
VAYGRRWVPSLRVCVITPPPDSPNCWALGGSSCRQGLEPYCTRFMTLMDGTPSERAAGTHQRGTHVLGGRVTQRLLQVEGCGTTLYAGEVSTPAGVASVSLRRCESMRWPNGRRGVIVSDRDIQQAISSPIQDEAQLDEGQNRTPAN